MHKESSIADGVKGPAVAPAPFFGLKGYSGANSSHSAALVPAQIEMPDQGRIMIPLCGPAAKQHATFAKQVQGLPSHRLRTWSRMSG